MNFECPICYGEHEQGILCGECENRVCTECFSKIDGRCPLCREIMDHDAVTRSTSLKNIQKICDNYNSMLCNYSTFLDKGLKLVTKKNIVDLCNFCIEEIHICSDGILDESTVNAKIFETKKTRDSFIEFELDKRKMKKHLDFYCLSYKWDLQTIIENHKPPCVFERVDSLTANRILDVKRLCIRLKIDPKDYLEKLKADAKEIIDRIDA